MMSSNAARALAPRADDEFCKLPLYAAKGQFSEPSRLGNIGRVRCLHAKVERQKQASLVTR
jgi:hypothetical protein